jgi:CO/xanthine dehydrogenase FAD-binding subunit
MIHPFDYKTPKTLQEACDVLAQVGEKAKVIAGGTDLVIALRDGDLKPECLIDITEIKELRTIEETNGAISIGAAVTHSEIASSSLVKQYGKVLSDAASRVGSPQIRNLGTLGGNIVNASPAADTVPALMVLEAVAKVVSKNGEREVPLENLFNAPYQTNLRPDEILVRVSFQKLHPDAKTSFVRLARRETLAIARMSVAVVLQREGESGLLKDVRISVGAVMPAPNRMLEAETLLRGTSATEEILQLASRKVSETMIQRSGVRPSTSYKAPVVEALFVRAVKGAMGRG